MKHTRLFGILAGVVQLYLLILGPIIGWVGHTRERNMRYNREVWAICMQVILDGDACPPLRKLTIWYIELWRKVIPFFTANLDERQPD